MTDEQAMAFCLELANLGNGKVAPNPMVGCVILKNKKIVASGYHRQYGGPHAEVNAFNALPKEIDPADCEVYVSLEPCSHFGKTPPCADLIIKKRPKRLVVGMLDPNPLVAGKGLGRIKNAGIQVKMGVLEDKCKLLNKRFVVAHTKNRPFVLLKWAETASGHIGRLPGSAASKKISDPRNDGFVHQQRASNMAILIGAETANQDNPKLDARHWNDNHPIKIILSKSGSVNPSLDLFKTGRTLVLTESEIEGDFEVLTPPSFDIESILETLYKAGIQSVLVEGGSKVLQQFINANLWDEILRLKSTKIWEDGITAPQINREPDHDVKQYDDQIQMYINSWQ